MVIKFITAMYTMFLLVSPIFLYSKPIDDLPIVFNVIEESVNYSGTLNQTVIELEYVIDNQHHHGIKAVKIYFDATYNDVPVGSFNFEYNVDVMQFEVVNGDIRYAIGQANFDSIEITKVEVIQRTFFESYLSAILMGFFYMVILLIMWMFVDRHQEHYMSDVIEIFKTYWWAASLILIGIPLVLNVLSYLGKYHVLATPYGWVFFISCMISMIFVIFILWLYHYIMGKGIIK